MTPSAQINLTEVAIEAVPEVVALLKDLFKKKNPDAPVPTSQEVIAAYNAAFQSDKAQDEAYLASHAPLTPPTNREPF